ncbi:hypothetical protein [Streptomyces sp. G-G2]|uniref:hypothetical protein n=1 Tax=Streptomyces sp. G-G2 TaxID=3046201 RepID=UPI0024B9F4EC|nr:hypothetical protein [Streptomyces sp. G-G2]MDJ0381408.1 hypothetical protein [Streptomyces sp. G-G2]
MAPGVLWPEHDHPAYGPAARASDLSALADGLAHLTGLRVRTEAAATPAADGPPLTGRAAGDLLLHQTAGTTVWHLTPARTVPHCRFRLRPGEVLHVPADWSWYAAAAPGTRYLVTHLDERVPIGE